ncbi:MAG: tRNA (uridine(34)/cytosine(34)/5-carboxymethylaminomethyluridine(34)-2'-O)-methyltransferase TrmL [Elusimicrobia bacterium]|nr:tRNA (uridine(34)/cytosine(34)/5-carboxymethylaminomethyluridine(34)-2'-O)-methyltransferase TrmL [Elusimicrobiota bacterium]
MAPKYEVVLVRPDIAGNTGQIGRSCMAMGCRLHLVHPLGYQITDANLKRAGLDYWPQLDLKQHDSVSTWMASVEPSREVWLLSTKAAKDWNPSEVSAGATLVFGSETGGLPPDVHAKWAGRERRIPIDVRARSLNLSACVAMTLGSLILQGSVKAPLPYD